MVYVKNLLDLLYRPLYDLMIDCIKFCVSKIDNVKLIHINY